MIFDTFSRELRDIVKGRFGEPTPIQEKAIPTILSGKNALIIAPTGSGKTEACLLGIFDKHLKEKPTQISILYITPLRALNRNMQDRLFWWANKLDIDISLRHGDTTQYERSKQADNPPDLLISTPETLQSILIGKVMKEHLKNIKWVIIDEVHELIDSKRGVQLSVGLERLRELTGKDFQIIGLSATVGSPIEVAGFLAGGRPVEIIDVGGGKKINISVESPEPKKEDIKISEIWKMPVQVGARLNRIWDLTKKRESVLIFTNTRESAEALSSRLKVLDNKRMETDGANFVSSIEAHHSSLSKNTRIEAEKRFKDKQIKNLVCTSSLELGIDIGSIDFVIQYMSPRQVSKLLQRVGRSGHDLERVSEGTIISGEADDVFESVAIAKLALEKKIEKTRLYGKSLDVLGHQIVGLSLGGDIEIDKAFEVVKRAHPFKKITKDEFFEVCMFMDKLGYIFCSDKQWGAPDNITDAPAKKRDGTDRSQCPPKFFIRRKKKGWEYYYSNLSMIPDTKTSQLFDIVSNQPVGSLDSEFVALNASPGTTIICKGQAWKILEIRSGFGGQSSNRIYVEPVGGIEASIPAWEGELIPVTTEVAKKVGELRRLVLGKIVSGEKENEIVKWLKENYPISDSPAEIIFKTVKEQADFGFVPDDRKILIEYIEPENGSEDNNYRIIFHTCFGSLINETIGRAMTTALANTIGSIGLKTDPYRIVLTPQTFQWKEIIDTFKNLKPEHLDQLLEINLTNTELFRWRFLHVAKRFGIISKDADYGKAYLKKIIEVYSKTPAYREALNEIFEEKLDIEGAKKLLEMIRSGQIKTEIMEGVSPLGKLAITKKYEIVPPEKPTQEIFEIFKERLENTEIGLVCCNCAKWSSVYTVKRLPKAIICPLCGARLVGAVPSKYSDDARKLVKKNLEGKKLLQEEKKWLNLTLDSGSLVITYGPDAAKVMAGRGIGVATAKRVLGKQLTGDDLLKQVLEAERQYAKNRRFWRG